MAAATAALATASATGTEQWAIEPPPPAPRLAAARGVSFLASPACAPAPLHVRATAYQPRDPTQGALHQLLRQHFETYLAARHARPPPPFVVKALRSYLLYGGILGAHARLRHQTVTYQRPGVTLSKRPKKSASPQRHRNTAWAELMRHSFGNERDAGRPQAPACLNAPRRRCSSSPHVRVRRRRALPANLHPAPCPCALPASRSGRPRLPPLRRPHAPRGDHPQHHQHRRHPPARRPPPPEPRAGPAPPTPGDTVYERDEAAQADLFEDDITQLAPDEAW